MKIGKAVKTPDERKRYTVDYSTWMASDEQLQSVDFQVETVRDGAAGSPPVSVPTSAITVDGKAVILYLAGGDDGAEYKLILTANTNRDQIVQRHITVTVEAC